MQFKSLLVLLSMMLWSSAAHSQICPSATNLVSNCGFDTNIDGYTPQAPLSSILHEPTVGATALGAMRVNGPGSGSGSPAEAQYCLNLGSNRNFTLAAQFRAINANNCFVGYDEFNGTDCTSSNGNYVASNPISVNTSTFSAFSEYKTVGPSVQSIELVILCSHTGNFNDVQFFVDDIGVVQDALFSNGFE